MTLDESGLAIETLGASEVAIEIPGALDEGLTSLLVEVPAMVLYVVASAVDTRPGPEGMEKLRDMGLGEAVESLGLAHYYTLPCQLVVEVAGSKAGTEDVEVEVQSKLAGRLIA